MEEGGDGERRRREGSKVGNIVGTLLGLKRGTYDETLPSVSIRVTVCNTCLISGDDEMIGLVLGTSDGYMVEI